METSVDEHQDKPIRKAVSSQFRWTESYPFGYLLNGDIQIRDLLLPL